MPSASRNANRKRRARRNVTLLKRAVQSEAISRVKTTVVTFAILNKLGGEIELSKSDLDSAALNLTKLSFVIEPSATEDHFMVRLVGLTEPTQVSESAPTVIPGVVGDPEPDRSEFGGQELEQ